ncbi:MAG: hypothetical protein OIF57_06595, partial [Marinobacterium sp.]|nr:hypothetical protein [Marinobacterium sp.]
STMLADKIDAVKAQELIDASQMTAKSEADAQLVAVLEGLTSAFNNGVTTPRIKPGSLTLSFNQFYSRAYKLCCASISRR